MNKGWLWLLLLLAPLIFLPQILSLSPFKPLLLSKLGLKGELEVKSIHLTWFGPQTAQHVLFSNRDIEVRMDEWNSPLPLWSLSKTKTLFGIKNGEVIYRNTTIEQVNGSIKGDQITLSGTTQTGHIQVHGTYQNKNSFHLTLDITALPLTEERLSTLLGPQVNTQGTITPTEVSLAIQTPRATTQLQATLREGGFALQKPLIIHWSPPFLASNTQVLLTVAPQGFFCPIPFSLHELTIGSAILDAGKIQCRNEGSLSTLLNFAKLQYRSAVDVWLTPILFRTDGKTVEVERADALIANTLHVCGWGTIDLVKEKYHLILGITADALRQVFGIQGLPEDYVFRIPVKGPLNNPTLVTGPATARIASLIAAQIAPQGKKIGIAKGILHILSHVKEDESAPPPKRPFPWE